MQDIICTQRYDRKKIGGERKVGTHIPKLKTCTSVHCTSGDGSGASAHPCGRVGLDTWARGYMGALGVDMWARVSKQGRGDVESVLVRYGRTETQLMLTEKT